MEPPTKLPAWSHANVYAYEKKHSTDMIALTTSVVHQRCSTYTGQECHTAFYNVTIQILETVLTFWGYHAQLIYAILTELPDNQGAAELLSLYTTTDFAYRKLR